MCAGVSSTCSIFFFLSLCLQYGAMFLMDKHTHRSQVLYHRCYLIQLQYLVRTRKLLMYCQILSHSLSSENQPAHSLPSSFELALLMTLVSGAIYGLGEDVSPTKPLLLCIQFISVCAQLFGRLLKLLHQSVK